MLEYLRDTRQRPANLELSPDRAGNVHLSCDDHGKSLPRALLEK